MQRIYFIIFLAGGQKIPVFFKFHFPHIHPYEQQTELFGWQVALQYIPIQRYDHLLSLVLRMDIRKLVRAVGFRLHVNRNAIKAA